MLSRLKSLATIGLDCAAIDVEVDINTGQAAFIIVGLGDRAVQEATYRVSSAIKNSELSFPIRRITCNLAPADLKKIGPSYDLPLALGILQSTKQLAETKELTNSIFAGELSLNGETRHINGVISMAMHAKKYHIKKIFLPSCDAKEASFIKDVEVYPIDNLKNLVNHLNGSKKISPLPHQSINNLLINTDNQTDFKYIKGQEQAKRALEIAASGAHNIFFNGSPGSGKTLMARTFHTILPRLTLDEALEVTRIYSIANKLSKKKPLITTRPFRSVHHTASDVSIVGGGRIPKPGEISLAHRGVLFLDEVAEFPSTVLEVLRQPLEDKIITINRAQGSITFPAQFILMAAMNPCPCGYYNVPHSEKQCICSANQVQRYQKKISGPLMDRIDLYIDISPVKFEKLSNKKYGEDSKTIQKRVQSAKDIQNQRFKHSNISANSEMTLKQIKEFCPLPDEAQDLIKQAMQYLNLSARGYHRVIKISRTIADLDHTTDIQKEHVAEALQYRQKNNTV